MIHDVIIVDRLSLSLIFSQMERVPTVKAERKNEKKNKNKNTLE